MAKRYSDIRSALRTGDIVLFWGTGFGSRVISWVQTVAAFFARKKAKKAPSHVEMVVRSGSNVMLFGSVAGQGVRLITFSNVVRSYKGKIAVRRLNKPISKSMYRSLDNFMREERGKPYERNPIELAMSALPFVTVRRPWSKFSRFCSELIGGAYKAMRLLRASINVNDLAPVDWDRGYLLHLQEGYRLGDPEFIEAD